MAAEFASRDASRAFTADCAGRLNREDESRGKVAHALPYTYIEKKFVAKSKTGKTMTERKKEEK